jgi:hypothetical protein
MRTYVGRTSISLLLVSALIAPVGSPAHGAEPDLELNASSGNVESVDVDVSADGRVRHTEDQGHGGQRTVTLVSAAVGRSPRIAIDRLTGDTWVTWWTDASTDDIHLRRRDGSTGEWTSETLIAAEQGNARNPEIVHDGEMAWIVFEDRNLETSIEVVGIIDEIEPFVRATIETTSYTGDVDVLIHSENGRVWVTWVDSATHVGWSEYDSATATWGPSAFQSYAGSTVGLARKAIRDVVVSP